jgi:putative ABC transport system permease protein
MIQSSVCLKVKAMPHPSNKPPRLAAWLMQKTANRDERPAILGDLDEEFHEKNKEKGAVRAYLWYWALAAASLPSFFRYILYWSGTMFKNYLTVALRLIKRHTGFTAINGTGLAVGMAAALLIGIYIQHELSFDRHHTAAQRIYRVCIRLGDIDTHQGPFTTPPMAAAMLSELPEIQEAVRISPWPRNYLIRYQDKGFLEKGIIYADGSIFDVFTIPFVSGTPDQALTEPNTLVLTRTVAQKYFGSANPLGETLRFEDRDRDFKVTGVVEDCPSTSHLQYEMIASLSSMRSSRETGWRSHTYFTYLLLNENIDAAQLEAKFPDFVQRHWGAQVEADTGMSLEELRKMPEFQYGYFLEPLTDIHLNPQDKIQDPLSVKGSRSTLFIFATIAAILLLIACINFMNLSTARFAHRCKEVGIRKVLGSDRRQLVIQFLGESGLLSLLSLGFAVLLIFIALPAFGQLAKRNLTTSSLFNPWTGLLCLGITLTVGIVAGSYPALFLSAVQPIQSLRKGQSGSGRSHLYLRRFLVFFQFSITFAVFFGTFVITSQMKFLRGADLGFNSEQVVILHRAYQLGQQREAFKQELLRHPEIKTISDTDTLPGRHFDDNGHRLEGRPASEELGIYTIYSDHNLVDLLDIKLKTGRFFSPEIPTDLTSAVVINQTAAHELGLEEPVGKRFLKEFGKYQDDDYVTIIGVVQDFNFQSLHRQIQPMIIRPLNEGSWVFTSIKLQSRNLPATLEKIQGLWDRMSGGQPFEYSFLDEDFNALYQNDQRMGTIFSIFALLAVLVASLGLFGLVSFNAEKRTKEIGVRKVLGASSARIVFLLSKEVVLLVAAASAAASPLAYYLLHRWLQNFAFRIPIHPGHFLFTAAVTLGIALGSIGYRALKAGRENPVHALKHE